MFLGTCLPCEPLSGCQMRWDRAGWSQALGLWLLAAAGSTCTWVGTRQIKFPRDPKEQFTFSHTLLLQEVWNVPKLCLQIEGGREHRCLGGNQSTERLTSSVFCCFCSVRALLTVTIFPLSSQLSQSYPYPVNTSAWGMRACSALDLIKSLSKLWDSIALPVEVTLLLHPSSVSCKRAQKSDTRTAKLWENHMPTLLKCHRRQISIILCLIVWIHHL